MFVIHDWLAQLSQEPRLLPEYGFSIQTIIEERTTQEHPRVKYWQSMVIGSAPTPATLLYRHYLVESALAQEIFPEMTFGALYTLMGSLLYQDVEFTPTEDALLWLRLETDEPLINRFRLYRSRIEEMIKTLAERQDITSMALQRDHGLLSTHTLLYTLYLIRVILIYENTINPDQHRQIILTRITYTLDQLKGVFFYD